MKTDINFSSFGQGIGSFFKRFHTLLFFLIVSGGLFAAILMLLAIITLSSTTAVTSDQAINGTFDETTIERLNQSSDQIVPKGRASPFVE